MALWKKILISLAVFFILFSIIGFLILPAIIKPIACEKLSAALHRPVSIEKISINPYALSVTIRGFKVNEPVTSPNPFLAFDELYVNLYAVSSLFQRKLILEDIHLTRPYASIKRREDSSYNFSDLLPNDEKKPAEKSEPFYFSLNNILIKNGSIDFWDGPNKTRHTVRNMNLAIPSISNIKNNVKKYIEPKFSARINDDIFELSGKTKPFLDSHETIFEVNLRDVDIPFYLKYVPVKMNFNLKSAMLDTKLKINFIMKKNKEPSIRISGDASLRKVVLNDMQNNKILNLPEFNCTIADSEPLNSNVHLSRISAKDIELAVRRNKAGEINLLKLVEEPKEKEPEKKPFQLIIDELQLEATDFTFADDVPAKKTVVHISPIKFKANNISTRKDAKSDIDLFLNVEEKGEISLKGLLGIEPLVGDFDLDAKNVAIRPFQSYFTDAVRVNVQQGAITTTGKLSLSSDQKSEPRIKYAGELFVSNLATVDESHANNFLNWKQLYFDGIQVGYNPFFLNIKGVSLTDFYTRIIINPDGTLNLQNIFGNEEKDIKSSRSSAESKAKEDDIAENIKIGAVSFQGGTINFADRFIKPNYSVRMLNMGGSLRGLSAKGNSRADINLKGNLSYGSPIDIKGKINPLIKDLFADVKVDFRDVELSPVTPYSSKYLGYPITKGKITFAVQYFIENRNLTAKNKILIDQLTLGDRVESPDAVKAPVGLAVSLLTDRKGRINLDIPVSGSLDDPTFDVWSIIWHVIVNLVTKAATSPFTLLSAITGGGEELSFVEFDYGTATLSEANLKKISALTKALQERPQLEMDIMGSVDPENDRDGIKKVRLNRLLKTQKLKGMADKGEAVTPIEQVLIKPEEYEKYLTQVYRAADFAKPRTVLGFQKKLPKEEMEKLMIAHMVVTDSDLRQLAARRAENVKELILKSGEVKSSQIFIVEPKTLAAEKKDKVKMSRVDFKLK